MTRGIAHQKSFEKALYAIADNFPPGKLLGVAPFADMYVNTSQGEGDMQGPWNTGDQWERVDDLEQVMPADDGDGKPTVKLHKAEQAASTKLAERTLSDPDNNPTTGADLGAGPGAGRVTEDDMGQAPDIQHADKAKAKAKAE